ncbi:MAG TPA: O-methyltransferase [Bacteriovoracaceae bacterium]|nr:O-methyltransferase [Bacteriovoracaceae bacterium]
MHWIPTDIEDYCISHSTRPGEAAQALQKHTVESVHGSQMLIGEMEGSVLKFLIRLGRAKRILELGTYTGYSALIMAEALPEDGKVITVDIDPKTTEIAKKYWAQSPHGKKIELILRPALEALKDLSIAAPFDLIFIDADKNNYPNYLEWSLEHLSANGVIVTDNTLWSGKVLKAGIDAQTDSIREHNNKARKLEGYTKTLLPIRDGMYLIQKG